MNELESTQRGVRTSIATVSLSGSLADKLAAVAAAGFDGVEIFENDLISSPLSPSDVAARVADLGLTVELYQPFRDPDSTDAARVRRSRERLRHKLDVTRELGCDLLLVCSTVAPHAVTDDERLTEQLHALADLAAERGVRLAYEALAWGTHVRDYGHAWSVVQHADHPALGTCLDSFHVLSRADDPAGIRDIPGEKIFFLQLADAPHLAMDVLPWSRHFRCFPGQGTFDLTGFAAQVHAAGYRGPWSLEVFNDVFREAATGRTATDARRSLLHLQEQVARAAVTQPEALNDRPPLFVAPQPAPVHGVVSLRFAAGTAAPELVAVLDALGFRFVGRHPEHDLQLWRHGPVAVAVDATADTSWTRPGVPAAVPLLSQIGVRAADPRAWARRAGALLVDAEEVELPGTDNRARSAVVRLALTAATSVDLRSPGSAAIWEAAFFADPAASRNGESGIDNDGGDAVRVDAARLTGVDHVGLAVTADVWDGVLLELRSVFDLQPQPSVDLPDALGVVRTQALVGAGTGGAPIRVCLVMVPGSSPDVGLGPVRRGGASHVAFACEDAVAVGARLAAAGLTLLPIPDNYYADIAARYDLDPALLDRMRAVGVLYDRDENGGELFHLCTPVVGDDLYVEVVQRVGGYTGFGEVNSAVRLAAQLALA